jgi:hypothetical protein
MKTAKKRELKNKLIKELRAEERERPEYESPLDVLPGSGTVEAVLYDGKQLVARIEVLKGALTVLYDGKSFERVEHQDIVGRKQATVRRNAIKFKRMSPEAEGADLGRRKQLRRD